MKIFQLLIVIALALVFTAEARNLYHDGKVIGEFVVIGGQEYFMSSEYTDVLTAIYKCNSFSMKLITLHEEEKNSVIKAFISSYDPLRGTSYWTTGRKFRDLWQWAGNGKLFSHFLDWESGMPNSELQEDICVGVRPTGWFDGGCRYNTIRYICEHLS